MSTEKPKRRYLKNAWVRKDKDGDYWLFIEGGGLSAMFCLSECMDLDADENSIVRRALEAWIADQDSGNGNL
jgi:hypothetical protein